MTPTTTSVATTEPTAPAVAVAVEPKDAPKQFRTPSLIADLDKLHANVAEAASKYNEAELALSFLDPTSPANATAIAELVTVRDEAHRVFNVLGGASAVRPK